MFSNLLPSNNLAPLIRGSRRQGRSKAKSKIKEAIKFCSNLKAKHIFLIHSMQGLQCTKLEGNIESYCSLNELKKIPFQCPKFIRDITAPKVSFFPDQCFAAVVVLSGHQRPFPIRLLPLLQEATSGMKALQAPTKTVLPSSTPLPPSQPRSQLCCCIAIDLNRTREVIVDLPRLLIPTIAGSGSLPRPTPDETPILLSSNLRH